MKTLRDFKLQNKRVLVRCDFNVPLDDLGEILDDFRIRATLPTIKYLIEKGARIILMSHLGRPEGKVVDKWKMTPIQDKLMEYLDLSVTKAPDCVGSEIEKWTRQMKPGEILLLENLRFHKEEEGWKDDDFARALARLGDIYVNDAFGASHRSHASIVGVPKYLPSAAGFLLEKEIEVLSKVMKSPQKPLLAIVGGAKVETKTGLINKISQIAEFVLVGGLINREIKEKNIKLNYPKKILGPVDEIDKGKDIGPETVNLFKGKINLAKTIFWNGPLGRIEEKEFAEGTKKIAEAIIESRAFSIVGGGETVDFINELGLIEKFNHVSSGGGAMLEFMSGGKLPGLEALKYAGN